ncbi:MAG TPA: ATP-binding protein [Saprospiraceae bacterium]|nr:ATP-binding protein [Saprospiraceae bacterium]
MELVGRFDEIDTINNIINSSKSELCAITGRRRVGKTFFIDETLKGYIFFRYTGKYKSTQKVQLEEFSREIGGQFKLDEKNVFRTWFDAFELLKREILKSRIRKKKVIVLDEFPWMATKNSSFLAAFSDFWTWASKRKDLLVVICGSAASWMVNNIFRSKGSLYNRVTSRIEIQPFTLKETALFFKKKNIDLKQDSIIKLYMVMGGIPFYLDQVRKGESADQAIDRLFFPKSGILRLEYKELFSSLFDNAEPFEKIAGILSDHRHGLSRNELLKKSKSKSGGNFTKIIDELETSGFITGYVPFGKTLKDAVFKLTDPYTLFYLKYVVNSSKRSKSIWQALSQTPSWLSWSGLAFENLCLLHIDEIKKQLKIEGIFTSESIWYHKGNDEMFGAQIDLVIDRADKIINICEIKYAGLPFAIDNNYHQALQKKLAAFQYFTKTRKTLFLTMITANGMVKNKYSLELVQNEVEVGSFF